MENKLKHTSQYLQSYSSIWFDHHKTLASKQSSI